MPQKSYLRFEVDGSDLTNLSAQPLIKYDEDQEDSKARVMLDKWLWAARFFKTRALARSAIENGYVYYDGQRTIPSKEIELGAHLIISQGKARKFIVIKQLSTRRRGTDEANLLFQEITRDINTGVKDNKPQQVLDEDGLLERKPRKLLRFLRRNISLPTDTNK